MSNMLVRMIGSKKKPMLPIKRADTVGKDIFIISLEVARSGFKSSILMTKCLDNNKN